MTTGGTHPSGIPWDRPSGKHSGIRPAGVPSTRPKGQTGWSAQHTPEGRNR